MRYPKGSIQLNQSRDLPLLRQILHSEYTTHSQLFEFMRLNHYERSRKSFDWRLRRLMDRGLVRRQTMQGCTGEFVYSVAGGAAMLLQDMGEYCLVCNYDLLQFISGFFRNSQCHVFFGLVKDWHAQLLDMLVSCCPGTRCIRLRETLGVGTERPELAATAR